MVSLLLLILKPCADSDSLNASARKGTHLHVLRSIGQIWCLRPGQLKSRMVSWACDLHSCPECCAQKGLTLGSVLCCHPLDSYWTRGPCSIAFILQDLPSLPSPPDYAAGPGQQPGARPARGLKSTGTPRLSEAVILPAASQATTQPWFPSSGPSLLLL